MRKLKKQIEGQDEHDERKNTNIKDKSQ